jgi:malonate-semialdehyde dehydrogenase (acetylating)/methylmalonate-semialdehyde dehydrogenase
MITEYIDQTILPEGVFNLVNGDKVAGQALIEHPLVKGVSLVGSTQTCRIVSEMCARNHKRCRAMGLAKNHLVAMPGAKVDDMLRNMITSCYGCAGQRCMAASAIFAVGNDVYETVCEKLSKLPKM